ncbi:single-stranded DNA-binding protein [Glycomyces sp. NPDC049804]|uniref:single-stranded DNA-binding protein n=1 Tax=Glycomyces sp. NPDC049804 TaxID=3154363 RepID=UPI00343DF559
MDLTCIIEGQIIKRDPETFSTPKGNQGVRFEIRRQPRYRNAAGEWVDGKTEFYDITCWGALADNVLASFKRYDTVIVTASALYAQESGGYAHLKVTASGVAASLRFGNVTPERKERIANAAVRTPDGEDLPVHPDDAWATAIPAPPPWPQPDPLPRGAAARGRPAPLPPPSRLHGDVP